MIYLDKTTAVQVVVIPRNGGRLPYTKPDYIVDAPKDGKTYGRKDGSWAEVTGGGSVDAYTKEESDARFASKSGTYTKTEVDAQLAGKANSSDVYTKSEVYTQAEVRGELARKADDTEVVHKAGAETITGQKTFSAGIKAGTINIPTTNDGVTMAASEVDADNGKVSIVGDAGSFTLEVERDPLTDMEVATKGYVDGKVTELEERTDQLESGKQDKLIAGSGITIAADGKTISSSGGDAEQYLAEIKEAMQSLPDGSAVSAQVALNTADIAEIDTALYGDVIDVADKSVSAGAYNGSGVLAWASSGFYHTEPIAVKKGMVFKGVNLKSTSSVMLLAEVNEDGTYKSQILRGSSISPDNYEYEFLTDCYVSISGYGGQNNVRGVAFIEGKGIIDALGELQVGFDSMPKLTINRPSNLADGSLFTKRGRWTSSRNWIEDDVYRTGGKFAVEPGAVIYLQSGLNYIGIAEFESFESALPHKATEYTTFTTPYRSVSLSPATRAIEIAVRDYNVGKVYVGLAESPYSRGFAPYINGDGEALRAVPAKLYDIQNNWKGKKYLSLGDSVTARDHWQRIVDFYLGTTHTNKAVGGTSIGTYAFNREGGGESTSQMGSAVATSLISASELQSMDLIIIASYINSAVSLGTQAELGSMDDTFISISEEAASQASSIGSYASSIVLQNFTQAARSTIEYILKNCGKAKVLIVGDLQFAGGGNYGTTNFDWTNNKGYKRRDYAKRMGEIAAFYGLPYVNLEECGGVNPLNASEFYTDNIHPNFVEYKGGDNWDECGMRHEAMPIIKAMLGM